MIEAEEIGLWNTGLPLLILGALAVVFPRLLVRRDTRAQWEVLVGIWASAGFLLIAGAVIFALIYGARGAPVAEVAGAAPLAVAVFFLRLSGYAAILWVPLLALVWFGMAQGVEKRKGEDLVQRNTEAKE